MNAEEVFHGALARPPAERAVFVAAACAGDEPLQRRVEALLHAHENPATILAQPPHLDGATIDEPNAVRLGTIIGPYKLIEQIGDGGMGTVYMAQQNEPVKRLVALKVIKPGMDSKQVLARFEAERQALALMDHPNIAKVLDAGATAAGRPYFVMELVKGVPLTKYCDEHKLTPRQRLELFIPVCQAIQHAHQKGIIHRDIKPSNVLLALYDGKPVPKVIDFGVAKTTGLQLTDLTLVTGFGAVVGTLEYMSPEQAELNQLDIDTRSDIYALGVLLYELLTGSTPLGKKRLKEAAFMELLRVIREEEPPKPSTWLSTTEELPAIAANRGVEPKKLNGLVRGELDWIVMKCLEKDRSRRYETANGLAMDVQRHLADEPVLACPTTAAYRFRKFARRNRTALAVSAVVCLALAAVTVAGTVAYWNEQRRRAEQIAHEKQLQTEKQQNALEKGLMAAMSADFDGAEKKIAEAELHGASTGQVRMLRGQVAFHRGDEVEAIQHLEQAVHLIPGGEPGAVAARAMLALAYLNAFQLEHFNDLSRELDPLEPITPEDFLFKGLLETWLHAERGLQTLDEGIRRHDSVLARATRLEARAHHAMVTGKVEDVELALEDAQVAERMLPGNALVLERSVFAHLVAAGIYETKGRPQDSERVLQHARSLVAELEQLATTPLASEVCFEYFEYVGDEKAAFAKSERGNQIHCAVMLYRRGEYTKALEAAVKRSRSRASGSWDQIERCLILPELPNGPARALAAYDEVKADPGSTYHVALPLVLLLLGKPDEARQAFLQVRKEEILPWNDNWWLKLWDYGCGRITADQLLQAAGELRVKLSDAHFLIGMRRLAEGDRAAAQEHFRKCVATRVFASWHWPWVRAFLKRMGEDPHWPLWIEEKK
jgi:serine/threonine protein kinase/tetratricopeptide (TPR) repeat protein